MDSRFDFLLASILKQAEGKRISKGFIRWHGDGVMQVIVFYGRREHSRWFFFMDSEDYVAMESALRKLVRSRRYKACGR